MANNSNKRSVFVPDPRIDSTKHVIPFFFENSWIIGEAYPVRICNVFDLSKFWIVGMNKDVSTYQTSLMNFYLRHGKQYKMHRTVAKTNKYCVARVNNAYFRAIIVNKFFGMERKVPVFLIDFGIHEKVNLSDLYHFRQSDFEVPRFAGRTRLVSVKPFNGYTWTNHSVMRFEALTKDRVLTVKVEHIDPVEKVLHVTLQAIQGAPASSSNITGILLNEKLAKKEDENGNAAEGLIPYFLPSFAEIESRPTPTVVTISQIVNEDPSAAAIMKCYIGRLN